MKIMRWAAVITLALVLTLAAVSKLGTIEDSQISLQQLNVFPQGTLQFLVYALIGAEVAVALSLLLFRRSFLAPLASSGLFASFLTYHAYRVSAGITVPCTCFGMFLRLHPAVGIIANCALVAISLFVLAARPPPHKVQMNLSPMKET